MRLISTLLAVVSLLVPAVVSSGNQTSDQSSCSLTAEQSPTLRGVRLAMGAEQLLALFPESSSTRNAIASADGHPHYGVASLFFQPPFLPSPAKERFAGIDSIGITLFDGSVTEVRMEYAGPTSHPIRGPAWRNVDDFITKLSEAYALPPAKDWFERSQLAKTLQCTGFTLTASIENGRGSITLRSNTRYDATVRQRVLADEERRRREFKP